VNPVLHGLGSEEEHTTERGDRCQFLTETSAPSSSGKSIGKEQCRRIFFVRKKAKKHTTEKWTKAIRI
jgi:hypothetical protein